MNYNKKASKGIITFILTFLYLSTGNIFAQDEGLFEIYTDNQRKFDYYFYDALSAKTQGKFAEAFDLFQHCHALDSTNANVLSELSSFYNVLQEKSKAADYLVKAVEKDPDNYYYNMMLASLYRELDRKEDAIDIYKALLEKDPQETDLYMALAEAYNDNGELDKAIEALDALEEKVGVREAITLNKFRLYSMLSEKEKAFDEIESIIKKNPDNLAYILLLGDLYMQDNQLEKSLEQYNKVKSKDPDYPSLVISMVNYYEKTGEPELAEEEIRSALINPMYEVEMKLELLSRYISLLQSNEIDTKKANPLFSALFDQHPHNTQLNFLYGSVLLLQENKEEAMEQFEIFANAEPNNPMGWEQMLRIALPDSLNKVVEITEAAIEYIPNAYQFYFYLGGAKYQQKKYKEALIVFEEGLEKMDEENPLVKSDFYAQIGDLNYHLGNKEIAFENYEKALKLNPQNLGVLNNYSYFLSLENRDLDKAERMSGITVKEEPTNATFLDTYGWVLFKQEAYTMSKIYIENAVKYSEDDPSSEVLEHYGDILYKTGETEEALEQWKKAKKIGSDSKTLNKKIRKKKYVE
ncbi:MAG TPA: tetratricopeptide repeat protein [Dysgonamonadaceae bacterium]|nr:tetratricopeptide repeat protein [Dysgonamonadaceae bacterium]